MKIVVFNVKYSENLGDGLLAQCIEAGLTSLRSAEATPDQIAIADKKQACGVRSKTIPDFRKAALSGR